MTGIDFQDIYYYVTGTGKSVQSWDDVPDYIRRTYDRLGIPEAEKKYLAGVGGQYDSEVVYHNIRSELEAQGVIFMGTDQALKEHEELFREYFGTIIPANDNKLAALNTAVWSGGSFIYVPPGVHVELPLQAYFRINTENMGQFERTLIIADEGSSVHYVEGCTAPTYSTASLHSAVVEIIVKKGARVRYTTIQNWSHNVYNLVTKRAVAYEDAVMEWVDGNLGSHLTMKYPSIYLMGERAHGEVLSHRVRRRRAAPGRGRQGHPRRAEHDQPHHLEVHLQGHRPHLVPRPGQGLPRLREVEVHGALRRADPGRRGALRHVPVHGDRRGGRDHRTRGHRLQGRLRAALLPDEPRPVGGRGQRHDRERLHRADRQGAADGVRGRDEPAHPAPDGRGGRLADVGFADDRSPPSRAEADWLRDLRADWEHRLAETPRPTGLEEEWRRTSLDALPWAAAEAAAAPRTTHELPAHLAEAGVVFGDLADVARDRPELVQRHLGRGQTLDSHAHFWALAQARWRGGTFLYVPRGVTVDETLVASLDLGAAPCLIPGQPGGRRGGEQRDAAGGDPLGRRRGRLVRRHRRRGGGPGLARPLREPAAAGRRRLEPAARSASRSARTPR